MKDNLDQLFVTRDALVAISVICLSLHTFITLPSLDVHIMSFLRSSTRLIPREALSTRSIYTTSVIRESTKAPAKTEAASSPRDLIKEQRERDADPVAADACSDIPSEQD